MQVYTIDKSKKGLALLVQAVMRRDCALRMTLNLEGSWGRRTLLIP